MSIETVRSIPQPTSTPDITIDFSPHRESFSYSVGSTVYSPDDTYFAHIGEEITLTATVSIPDDIWIVGYEWDFGDGVKGFGNPATHTYALDNTHMQVGLTITDNLNRKWRARKAMYLREP